MEFNTQICTTIEQSKRLLGLGLDADTSDMCWVAKKLWGVDVEIPEEDRSYILSRYKDVSFCSRYNVDCVPAWTLHRLINMMPYELDNYNYTIHLTQTGVEYSGMFDSAHGIEELVSKNSSDNLYDNIIDCIEWLIKGNYFNKEYLKKED